MKRHSVLARLLREDSGQDIIEYALLAAFIGCLGAAAWTSIKTGLGNKYSGWDTATQTLSACTPDPGGGGC